MEDRGDKMKLDFEEKEDKEEIKITELLSKLKEKDVIIDSQASVKRDLEDDIEALEKRISILTRKNKELDTKLQELTNLNTALEKTENYKSEIEEILQENLETLSNNEDIQKRLVDIPKKIDETVNQSKNQLANYTDILTSRLEKRLTAKILKNDGMTWVLFLAFIGVLGFNIIKINSLDIEIYKNNQKLDQLDLLFKSEKKYWYDEANQRIYIDKEKDLKEYLEKKAKKK